MKIGKETIHMADGLESSLQPRTPETQQISPRARLITGAHLDEGNKIDAVNNRLDNGFLNAHFWPQETSQKLKGLSPQPNVLIVDGMTPEQYGRSDIRDFDAGQKRRFWSQMPGNPKDINKSGDVLYVLGDMVGESYREVLKPFYTRNIADPDSKNRALAEISKKRPEIDSASSLTWPDLYTSVPSMAAVVVALTAAVNYTDKKAEEKGKGPHDAKTYTRRSILKLGAFGLGMAAAGSIITRYGPRITVPKTVDDNIFDSVVRVLKREKSDNSSVDGRTALMIEKGIFAAKILGQQEVAVVAGDAHEHNKDNLLANPQARADAVVSYATTLLKIVDEASKEAGFTQETNLAARGILLDNLMYGQIMRVKDPGATQVSREEIDGVLDSSIKFQSDFMLSNGAVSEAVDALRQGAPKVVGPFG